MNRCSSKLLRGCQEDKWLCSRPDSFQFSLAELNLLYSGYRCLTSMFQSSISSSAHPASQVTCNAALSALARVGLWQSAAQWFEDMRLHRPLPDDIGTMASKNCRAGWTNLHRTSCKFLFDAATSVQLRRQRGHQCL